MEPYVITSFLHKIKSGPYGFKNPCKYIYLYIYWFPSTLPVFMSCSAILYLLYNIWHTKHFQSIFFQLLSFLSDPKLVFPSHLFFNFLSIIFFSLSFRSIFANMEPFLSRDAASKALFKVNRALLVQFQETIETKGFLAHFNIDRLHVMHFLKWTMYSNTVLLKQIADVMRARTSARSKQLKLIIFSGITDPNLQKVGADRVRQVLRAFLVLATNAKKDPRRCEFFFTLFRTVKSSVANINGV